MQSYIEKRFNLFLRSKVDYSNLESLDTTQIKLLNQNFTEINFNLLTNYIESQQSLNDFIKSENMKLCQKLNFIKNRFHLSFQTLKLLTNSNSNSDWHKIPEKAHREELLLLEKFNLISIKNSSEFKFINRNIKTFI